MSGADSVSVCASVRLCVCASVCGFIRFKNAAQKQQEQAAAVGARRA